MKKKLVYGPVPSRRLGRSLGVDLVPYKVCTYDCIYCQLGRTRATTTECKPYIKPGPVLADVSRFLKTGPLPDYITLAGSGEPTLNSSLGEIIDGIKAISDIPLVVLTNGSLLGRPEVADALLRADIVAPNLDGFDEKSFCAINRPDPSISYDEMVAGLRLFSKIYPGRIWLEVFLVAGINDTYDAMDKFKKIIDEIGPDKVHVNTAVRPTADADVRPVKRQRLFELSSLLGKRAEVIAEFKGDGGAEEGSPDIETEIMNLVSRRPCTVHDMALGLKRHESEILKYLDPMVKKGLVEIRYKDGKTYFRA